MSENYHGPGAWFMADIEGYDTELKESQIHKDEKAMEAIKTLQEKGYTADEVWDAMVWAREEEKEKPDG